MCGVVAVIWVYIQRAVVVNKFRILSSRLQTFLFFII